MRSQRLLKHGLQLSTIPRRAARRFQSTLASTSSLPENAVVFSGIQPTGVPHLGNYLGALQSWKQLQDGASQTNKLLFCIVDLHAITMPQQANVLRQRRREMLAAFLAIGLDPDRSVLFYQSSVSYFSRARGGDLLCSGRSMRG
jgi:tryptophanyl-tRNA synthetase